MPAVRGRWEWARKCLWTSGVPRLNIKPRGDQGDQKKENGRCTPACAKRAHGAPATSSNRARHHFTALKPLQRLILSIFAPAVDPCWFQPHTAAQRTQPITGGDTMQRATVLLLLIGLGAASVQAQGEFGNGCRPLERSAASPPPNHLRICAQPPCLSPCCSLPDLRGSGGGQHRQHLRDV